MSQVGAKISLRLFVNMFAKPKWAKITANIHIRENHLQKSNFTKSSGKKHENIGDIREYFCNNANFLYDTISPRFRIFQEMEKGIFFSTLVVTAKIIL
jgi:acetone carboxylase gamma subunit